MSTSNETYEEALSRVRSQAAQSSTKARQIAGHNRRVAQGIPCIRCRVCYPEEGRPPKPLKTTIAGIQEPTPQDPPKARTSSVPKTPVPATAPPTVKDPTFKDRAERMAVAGLSGIDASSLLGMDLRQFVGEIETTFGFSWDKVLAQMKLRVSVDLQVSALNEAKAGDWKPLLALIKIGLLKNWVEVKEKSAVVDVDERIRELNTQLSENRKLAVPASLQNSPEIAIEVVQ